MLKKLVVRIHSDATDEHQQQQHFYFSEKVQNQCSQHFFTFSKKFKINVVINGGKTKYQCCQQFLLFREKFKIQETFKNNVVIDGVSSNYQCSQRFFFFKISSKSMWST
jgi:hypothetical protein